MFVTRAENSTKERSPETETQKKDKEDPGQERFSDLLETQMHLI